MHTHPSPLTGYEGPLLPDASAQDLATALELSAYFAHCAKKLRHQVLELLEAVENVRHPAALGVGQFVPVVLRAGLPTLSPAPLPCGSFRLI